MKIKQQKNEFGHFFHSALIKFGLWPCLSLLNRQHQWLSAVDRGFKTMKLVFVTSMLKYFFLPAMKVCTANRIKNSEIFVFCILLIFIY